MSSNRYVYIQILQTMYGMGKINDNLFHCSAHWNTQKKMLGYFHRWNPSFFSPHIYCPVLGSGGGRKTWVQNPSLLTQLHTRCAALSSFRHFVSEKSGWKGLGLSCVFVFLRYCLYNGVKLRMSMRSSVQIQMCMRAWILSLTRPTRGAAPLQPPPGGQPPDTCGHFAHRLSSPQFKMERPPCNISRRIPYSYQWASHMPSLTNR